MRRLPPLLVVLASALAPFLPADDLGGGKPASHGRVPRFVLESWLPGSPSAFRFEDAPASALNLIGLLSSRWASTPLPPTGTLMVDPLAPGFTAFVVPVQGLNIPGLPRELAGHDLYYQGLYLDPLLGVGFGLTDATRASFFTPLCMVGNSRQTANSISVLDLGTRSVVQRLADSENGSITFSPDRSRAYVCEPGSQRNRVVVYDLTRRPIAVLTTIPVSGGVRYRGAMARDGHRLYVPLHDGVAIVDTDPASPTFHQEIGKRTSLIQGNSTTIFTGPIDVAITPDMRKLFIAYGENLIYPAPSSVGVMDLFNPAAPERLIPITTGGAFSMGLNLATHNRIEVSPDGTTVYVLEYGVTPMPGLVVGFQNGALICVIDALREQEIMAIPTQGFGQEEFALDRMGRNL